MAKQEQLDLLMRGVREWNEWRDKNPYTRLDLSTADLRAARLSGADLSRGNLSGVRLSGANLRGANLRGADLSRARLNRANFRSADLRGACLREADLTEADLRGADLTGSDLREADLMEANLAEADLRFANLGGASLAGTILGGIDLREVSGLETAHHRQPSYLSVDTIYRSAGQIPGDFLRGTGVPDSFIVYMRSLVSKPIDYATCFIRCSSKDEVFAHRLCADLQRERIPCWFASEPGKPGDPTRYQVDEPIRFYDRLLLVLSEHSLASPWVQDEVEAAFEKERRRGRQVLFPIALDDGVKHTARVWAATLRRSKSIGDFTRWKQHDDYQRAFERLLRDLRAET